MHSAKTHRVIPRNVQFDTATGHGRAWMNGDPVATAVFNALSLTFPDGERLFMDAVRHYRPQLTGQLAEEARAFIAQEAIHTREHVGLNAGLDRAHYPVDAIEAELRGRIRYLETRGPVAMLGVTIALEHFTAMMADLFLEDPTFWAGVPDEIVRLWQWHAMEETEHKAVAFDVFREISRSWTPLQRYRVRVQVMLVSTILFSTNITGFAAKLLIADGTKPVRAHLQVLNYLFGRPGLFRRSWRAYWDWYRPGFHPWDHDNSDKLDTWRGLFPTPQASGAAAA